MKQKIPSLQILDSQMIGDGQMPNLFFVSEQGVIVTVTCDFSTAYSAWNKLATQTPRIECALEDRVNGTIADVGPSEDEPTGKLFRRDDSVTFGLRKPGEYIG